MSHARPLMEVADQRHTARNYVFTRRRRTFIVPSCRPRPVYAIVIVKTCVLASNVEAYFGSDRVAGPFSTLPSIENRDP